MLVRHAEAVAPSDPRYEENDRPLADGRCAVTPSGWPISSPPKRWPPSTRAPTRARCRRSSRWHGRLALEISPVDDLRERLLSLGALPDWREQLQRSWTDFGYALEDGESSAEAQRRVSEVLATLRRRHPAGGSWWPATAT